MSLPESDLEFLAARNISYQVQSDGAMTCVIVACWRLPIGLNTAQADVLLRLVPGYPDLAPDMWWCDPALTRADGTPIPATEVREIHLGRTWQRWSRHFLPGQWKSGIDGLESYFALIQSEFQTASAQRAA
jgi:hypothetical protein